MPTQHPSWCLGTEPPDADHVSQTLYASGEDDPTDIRLRLSQPESEPGDVTPWTTLEIDITEEGQTVTYPLDLPQARALADSVTRLLPNAAPEPLGPRPHPDQRAAA